MIDTDPVRVDGAGHINLADETLNLQLQGKPKSFQLVRLRAPITLTGPWAHPVVGVKASPALAQGGIAAALGFLNPLASISPLLIRAWPRMPIVGRCFSRPRRMAPR